MGANGNGIAGVDAHGVEVFDGADDDAVVGLVAHDLHFNSSSRAVIPQREFPLTVRGPGHAWRARRIHRGCSDAAPFCRSVNAGRMMTEAPDFFRHARASSVVRGAEIGTSSPIWSIKSLNAGGLRPCECLGLRADHFNAIRSSTPLL